MGPWGLLAANYFYQPTRKKTVNITVKREHEICAGHRVVNQGGKCEHLHGHGYVFTFHCVGALNDIGMVIDFGVIKSKLSQWLEDNWDHRMLIWEEDPFLPALQQVDPTVVSVPFNPTAENMGIYLVNKIGPIQLEGTGVVLSAVNVQETRKCSAMVEL